MSKLGWACGLCGGNGPRGTECTCLKTKEHAIWLNVYRDRDDRSRLTIDLSDRKHNPGKIVGANLYECVASIKLMDVKEGTFDE